MSVIHRSDAELIEKIKRKIEEAYSLDKSENWLHKDYEYLAFFIEDKTGVKLSLSTVKRVWKNEYSRLSHISTLNALSQLAYHLDWLPLKKSHLENGHIETHAVKENRKKSSLRIPVVLSICSAIVLVLFLIARKTGKTVVYDEDKVEFSCTKTTDGNIPNTVVFHYNIEAVKADRFFIQQSWDPSKKVEIFKGHNTQTDIYYLPGYFMAKLIADDTVIKEIPVHITYNDWFMAERNSDSVVRAIDKKLWQNEPFLAVDTSKLQEEDIDLNAKSYLGLYNVREFGVDGDNFSYTSLFKMDSLENVVCPDMSLLIKGEHGYFWIMHGNKGCESELNMQLSDKIYGGKKQDLTMFGTNLYDWQKIGVFVKDKKITITRNGENIFEDTYNQPIGPIKDISYFFKGIGKIDEVELKDGYKEIKFSDDFED